ncbi:MULTISPECIES: DUF6338 family protein [Bacillaceae]|uniref:Uncharacterized protein n=1 Tax=Evansella alkalicola TaxID=745819 RepID=A0ABS6JXM3_9BACI|nr:MULTISPECIES: DUF6338 family protein [Bacillaceae]MBU9723145.1 hypothetical protein [Bacillus alkalicola]
MSITNYTVLMIVLLFIVPGFIIDFIRRKFISLKDTRTEFVYIQFLIYSCFNYGVWAFPIYYLYKNDFQTQHPMLTFLFWISIMFVFPIVFGLISVIVHQYSLMKKFYNKLGLNPIHPTAVSWDYVFNNKKEGAYVTIHLKDNQPISGYFGSRSFASSLSSERDIFLEKIYELDEDGNWIELTPLRSIWIKGDEIKAIEYVERSETEE